MSTDLEEYLRNNRSKLDIESPDDSLIWGHIRKKLEKRGFGKKHTNKVISLTRILNVAAMLILVFLLGYITKDVLNIRQQGRVTSLSGINDDLGQRERQYRKLLDYKNDEVKYLTESDSPVIRELFEEIKRLDLIYDQSIKDLNELGSNERIINTIFDIYEKKIYLLELIIFETNKINSHEEKGNINL
jgi:hypothetical protein